MAEPANPNAVAERELHELKALHALLPAALHTDAAWAKPRLEQVRIHHASGQPSARLRHELNTRLRASVAAVALRSSRPLKIEYPDLPVAARRDEIIASLRQSPVLVLTGETGSGKTTQLPKMLVECGYGRRGRIAMTQPRRLAATAVAARLRDEMQATEPTVVHAVRFDERSTTDTVIEVCTDGLLLARAQADPDLLAFDAIVIDEAHERSLNIDLLLGVLRHVRHRRPDLAVVISSATIEAQRFSDYFAPCPIIAVAGRSFPVELRYAPPGDDDAGYLDATRTAIRTLHTDEGAGDVLAFLPTERDILEAARSLDDLAGATVVPLFGRLTPGEQQKIFASVRGRKIVLATPIAETSLTVPGIRYVVDSGLARTKRYHAGSRTERLPIEAISQANAVQRAGRAGRVEAGVCLRLYSAEDFSARPAAPAPEILRSNLAGVMLTCLGSRLGDPRLFPWLDAPPPQAWDQARMLLDELGALTPTGQLTGLGKTLAGLPCDPQIGRILVAGQVEGVAHEACTIAAFLSIQDPRVRPLGQESKADSAHRALAHPAGDLITVLRLWARWDESGSNAVRRRLCDELYLGYRRMREWADVRNQLWGQLREPGRGQLPAHGHKTEEWPIERIHRSVLCGMLGNVLMYDAQEKSYRGSGDRVIAVHPGSALRPAREERSTVNTATKPGKATAPPMPPWLLACEIVETSRLFARLCAPIDPAWVVALAGDRLRRHHRDPHYHAQRQRVMCVETLSWKGLPVADGRLVPYAIIDPAAATALFIDQALAAEGEPPGLPAVVAHNRRAIAAAMALRERARDTSINVDRSQLAAWWRERFAGATVASATELNAWLEADRARAQAAHIQLRDVVDPTLAERADVDYPDRVRLGGDSVVLNYRFSPGDVGDGATLDLSSEQARWLTPEWLESAVPGWLGERVLALVQQLPKDDRRALIPLAQHAATVTAIIRPQLGQRRIGDLLIEALRPYGIRAAPCADAALPAWLRLRLRTRDDDGTITDHGHDHAAFFGSVGIAFDRLRPLKAEWETTPGDCWPGDLPAEVRQGGIVGYVGLARDRDRRGLVAVRRSVYASHTAYRAWNRDGLDALLECHLRERIAAAVAAIPPVVASQIQKSFSLPAAVAVRGLILAQARAALAGRSPRSSSDWLECVAVLNELKLSPSVTWLSAAWFGSVCHAIEQLRSRLRLGVRTLLAGAVAQGVGEDLERLSSPGIWSRLTGPALLRLNRYIAAASERLASANRGDAAAKRWHERSRAVLTTMQSSGAGDSRLAAVCGQAETVRELWSLAEDCISVPQSSGGSGGEGRLYHLAHELNHAMGSQRDAIATTRTRLIEHHGYLPRIRDAQRREQFTRELSEWLRDFPDLTTGADLDEQRQRADDVCRRVRAAL